MRKSVGIFLFSLLASLAFPEQYAALLPQNSTHFVVDNRVNVRSEPNTSSSVIGQFQAGDKVTIQEVTDQWYEAEGVCAPWYKVSSRARSGYVCGRYLTHKEAVGDIDGDGQDEVIGCVTVSETKGSPLCEYMASFRNWDIEHAILKDGRVTKLALSTNPKEDFHADTRYSISVCDQVSPSVVFLIAAKGFGDGGGSWEDDAYYYYDRSGKFLYAFTLKECYYECDFNESNSINFRNNSMVITHDRYEWKGDCDPPDYVQTESSESRYAWVAGKFLRQ